MVLPYQNLEIFACAETFCAHHSTKILSDHGYINTLAPSSLSHADAGEMIWSQIVEKDNDQQRFWVHTVLELKIAVHDEVITTEQLAAAKGLPERRANYEEWAAKAAEALIAFTRAELLASGRAEMVDELKKKAELEARHETRERYSPVSPIDQMDLAMVDWNGPEPSNGRPSPGVLFGASVEADEGEEAAAAAPYLDLDSLAPLVEVASAERLTPVKARIVDC